MLKKLSKNIIIAIYLGSLATVIIFGFGYQLYKIYSWKNPEVNINGKDLHSSIYDTQYKTMILESMGTIFEVNYIESACSDCINPWFPIIHITTAAAQHNAWLHIVRTDNSNKKLQKFIDTNQDSIAYPFYTRERDFYDAPRWSYTFLKKPCSFWQGHVYAIYINPDNKNISFLGGIKWGFTLSLFNLYPQIIQPSSLTVDECELDWEFFKQEFEKYTILKTS